MLPFLRPIEEKFSMLGIMRDMIGKDMTKISMPIILNEPLGTLQKTCEQLVIYQELLVKAAKHEDPLQRLILACTSIIAGLNIARIIRKKPFNPVLGETFEYVSDEFRYISE